MIEAEYRRIEQIRGWDELYEAIGRKSRTHNWTVADQPANKKFIRYQNVKPYDHSRVRLQRLGDFDYINANYVVVTSAARKYILTQGPLPETISHFWLMVWEQKSNVIVMLNTMLEMDCFNQCEVYWPDKQNKPIKLNDVKLEVSLKTIETNKSFCVRKIIIKDTSLEKDQDNEREVLHFHYTAWPDHGQPESPMSFLRLLAAVRKTGGLDKMDEPSVIHCSAGIGRSGTFCLIDSALTIVENQGNTELLDIESLLTEMRDYRPGLIQSSSQLHFSYTAILYGVSILEKAKKLDAHMSPYNPPSTSSTLTALSTASTSGSGSAQPAPSSQSQFEFPPSPESSSAAGSSASTKETSIAATKKPRRASAKKKQTALTSTSTVNIFNKHLLVNALEEIDSDTADEIFNKNIMLTTAGAKKARKASAEEDDEVPTTPTNHPSDMSRLIRSSVFGVSSGSAFVFPTVPRSDTPDSTILKRREMEFKTRKLSEKTIEIKSQKRREEFIRERTQKRIHYLTNLIYGTVFMGVCSLAITFYCLYLNQI